MRIRTIHYEPHPVSKTRKDELKASGLRIVDARFAPPTAQALSKPQAAAPVTPPLSDEAPDVGAFQAAPMPRRILTLKSAAPAR